MLRISNFANLGPLHLSRILYKSPLFMQNEPKFRKSQMNVNRLLKKNYEKKDTWWTGKKRTETNPISKKPKMNVSSIATKNYENICPRGAPKNKPDSNPNKPDSPEAKISPNIYYTKGYSSETAFRRGKNKPKQTQFLRNANHCLPPFLSSTEDTRALFPLTSGTARDYNRLFSLISYFQRTPIERAWKWIRKI